MALADIVVNDGQGTPVAHTFKYVATTNGRVIRKDFAAGTEEPIMMAHAHNTKTVNGKRIDGHLYRLDVTLLDSDGVTPHTANIRLCADVPSAIYSDGLADNLAAYVRNWATNANVRDWLKGSVG